MKYQIDLLFFLQVSVLGFNFSNRAFPKQWVLELSPIYGYSEGPAFNCDPEYFIVCSFALSPPFSFMNGYRQGIRLRLLNKEGL